MSAPFLRLIAAVLLLAASALPSAPRATAAETLRVGKAVAEAFSFVPLDIGMRKGFFAKQGLDIESIAFTGDARMQQAMASDSLDIALGSGPAMAFIVKGGRSRRSPPWRGRRCCWRSLCGPTARSPPLT
jgi:ABC-type nitrate/sulfonate/bicarbonate transport system substrate-binding protein